MKTFFSFMIPAAFVLVESTAEARPFRVGDIPNGAKFGCLNCHGDNKASYNTDFGGDARIYLIPGGVVSSQHIDWTPLCPLDSDRDGWTNGQELGDPDCVWKTGDADPKGLITNPGVYESAPPPVCGSGKLEANEACDGDLLSETNCAFVGCAPNVGINGSKRFERRDLIANTHVNFVLLAPERKGRPTWTRTRNSPVMSRGL